MSGGKEQVDGKVTGRASPGKGAVPAAIQIDDVPRSSLQREAFVELTGVTKCYGESLTVLDAVDLVIEEGEFLGIVGASGSGKTTLMNLIGCLDRPSAGRYVLDGEDLSKLPDDSLSDIRNRKIGFVFQAFNLIHEMTVLENVEVPLFYKMVPRRKRRSRCLELLQAVGLSHRVTHYPNQLSGGECQRVAIARALVNDPAILLADEPTGNLDSKSGIEILKLFRGLHDQGRTIIMVTHNIELTRDFSRVIELRDGRVLRDFRPGGKGDPVPDNEESHPLVDVVGDRPDDPRESRPVEEDAS